MVDHPTGFYSAAIMIMEGVIYQGMFYKNSLVLIKQVDLINVVFSRKLSGIESAIKKY